jgi:hypothetical protein
MGRILSATNPFGSVSAKYFPGGGDFYGNICQMNYSKKAACGGQGKKRKDQVELSGPGKGMLKEGRLPLEQAALERRFEGLTSLLPFCRTCGGIQTDEACREQVKRFVRSKEVGYFEPNFNNALTLLNFGSK